MAATVPIDPPTDPGRPLAVPTPRPRGDWDAWGSEPARLPAAAKTIVATLLPGKAHPVPHRPAPVLTPSLLPDDDLSALAAVVGADAATRDDAVRMLHLGGKSTPDLLRRRLDDLQAAPDAVVSPADHAEVAAVLRVCADRGIAVVPFGGGTSVVGGVDPVRGAQRAVITLDLSRAAALLALDEVSLLATFGAGTTGPQAEELLGARGYTLGHFPQSFPYASLGGYAATRSSGQASRGYGRFDHLVHALRVSTPAGDLDLGRSPASAAGPDLRQLFLGSEGAFGVLTEVTVRIRPVPAATAYRAWSFPDFAAGASALREATQRGIRPTVLRLSDETETRVNAAMGGHLTRLRGCLAVATFEGATSADAEATRDALDTVFRAHGASSRGEDPARSWERSRFASPALRDTLMDIGVLAETLETATTWANLSALKAAVTAALTESLAAAGTKPIVLCHISHVYPAGASLYFTVVAALTDDPQTQWMRAKDAASRAIGDAHGTITHHHAVGRDHRPYLEEEIGPLGVQVLRAVKNVLDPRGIMNPGALVEQVGDTSERT
ncbi:MULTISPECIES: FAD-binding oxidoreductase [Microbacterium]|uniref:Putative FAD-linked oxidoreductase n=1 Tax=Microbacterium trichothecenolyticum TaxID=69370 RepID=A0A0M2HBX8_MICTR|nr:MULTISPECIES: FAD-binding oxidoreductase [Microbacterium]KJL44086.1 putative FAD-linked oxidoreductase [Microbacterium trichothecenolyticum]MDR7189170.1 alkyldihydroxyacetonephosphate synthase [Microbacterium sp. BE35]